jgi:peptide deformylase
MPKILDIIINPNPILRKKSEEIKIEDLNNKDLQELMENMAPTMLEKDGVGLAAPQVGKNIRLIVINTKDGVQHFINPKIIKKSILKEWGEEGCLSVPHVFGMVKRSKKVYCEYFNIKGEKKSIEAYGLMARILQHEIDHLDGILFIDKAKDIRE